MFFTSYYDSHVVNGFFKHFFGVFGSNLPEDEISPEHEQELKGYVSRPSSAYNHFLVEPFELTELDRAIGTLPRKKSPGHDCILNEHIIHGGESNKQILLMLFNSVLRSTRVPDDWQTSIIIPIYKGKGKAKSDPSSYRPISLIPVVSKLFEKLILSRIAKFLQLNSVEFPNPQQQGFQPNLSCLTTAFALQETVLYHIERHSDVYVASLDQKAAFDTVRFRALFLKLGRLGFTGPFLRLLMSTYTNLKAVVRISGFTSDTIMVKRSVRQGGVLSTFLYLVYVNDLLNDLEASGYGSKVMSICCGNPAFADDISLLALTPFHLQRMIDIVYQYCQHWNVVLFISEFIIRSILKTRTEYHSAYRKLKRLFFLCQHKAFMPGE